MHQKHDTHPELLLLIFKVEVNNIATVQRSGLKS